MTDVLAEIAELRSMPTHRLVERYTELHGKPPRSKNRNHLFRRCAWKVQERRYGGLSKVAKKRLDELIGEIDIPTNDNGECQHAWRTGTLAPGTVVEREWRGQIVRATALAGGGFECEGLTYRSLSAVAKAVTGSHWNGRLFFGLTERKPK